MSKKFLLLLEKIIGKFLSLKKKEKIIFFVFLSLFFFGSFSLIYQFYLRYSKVIPIEGGVLKLGLIGQPRYINPILTRDNDADRFLIELLYNGLLKVDGKGNLKNDLASKIEISQDGKTFLVFLKENIFWHDGVPFSSDDIIFTIEAIQNKEYKSPLRETWQGVIVEKISPSVVRFTLNKSNRSFLDNLTLKILPKHIWENISPKSFPLTDYNIKPIGTGPFLFENLEKNNKGDILSYTLVRNEHYFENKPYIFKIKFFFYDNYSQMKTAFLKKEIDGLLNLYFEDFNYFAQKKNYQIYKLKLNRYFAVFYNLDKNLFQDKNLREALELSINKKAMENNLLKNRAVLLDSPFDLLETEGNYQYNPEKAKELIKGKDISFTLSLPEDDQLIKVAQFLKEEWQKIGINVELEILPIKELEREVILPKSYESLLFGEIVDLSFDLFPFWHSSQANSYKLNLSSFKNKDLDELIEENWNADENKRMEIFQKMKEIFQKEKPALFLYNPYYLYVLPKKIQGHNIKRANIPAEIFSDVSYWYMKVERILKW